jgi:hypothetical protein
LLRVLFVDQLAHGWDLARAIGADPTIPERLLGLGDHYARSPYFAVQRHPSRIDVEVPLDGPASPSERFAAFLGRDPRWAPPVRPA